MPNGFSAIYDEKICEQASNILGFQYQESENVKNSRSVCYWCGACNPQTTRVSINHGYAAKWICQKGIS